MTIVFHRYFDRNPKFSIELLGISIEILGFSFEILDISKICNNRIPEVFRSKSKVLDRNNRYFDRNTAQKKCYLASPPPPPRQPNEKKHKTSKTRMDWYLTSRCCQFLSGSTVCCFIYKKAWATWSLCFDSFVTRYLTEEYLEPSRTTTTEKCFIVDIRLGSKTTSALALPLFPLIRTSDIFGTWTFLACYMILIFNLETLYRLPEAIPVAKFDIYVFVASHKFLFWHI